MSEVTRLLGAAAGDGQAAAALLPLVSDELRQLAAPRMDVETPGHTLNATALVHEVYLRLVGDQQFDGRSHFFAAEAMPRVLVKHARDRNRLRRPVRRRACRGRPRTATGSTPGSGSARSRGIIRNPRDS